MEDYTKFKLKSIDDLTHLLENKDDFFVISCNKCFKEFSAEEEPENSILTSLISSKNKRLTGTVSVDFLCNKFKTKKLLADIIPDSAKSVIVVSCGLGVQTVADLVDLPVYTATDSIPESMHHGMALTNQLCQGCGQCNLNQTAGVCPVTECTKQLLNGQCGGSKDGKCEADKNKDCAWDKITKRSSGRNEYKSLAKDDIHLFNNNKNERSFIRTRAADIRNKRLESFYGGLYLKECKDFSASLPLRKFPVPKTVTIPMSQHAGMSADPIVKVGDRVRVGQKIGEAVGVLSSSVHASISGVVTEIAFRRHPNSNQDVVSITIKSDGKDQLHNSVIPIGFWADLDIQEIDAIIAEKGIVGMGGAGFPTPVKLKSPKPIDTILLNGSESEPYITADHRIMLEYTDDILFGLRILMKSTSAERGIIVIGDNKIDAAKRLMLKTADLDNIHVITAKTKYPKGAERMLLLNAIGRRLPSGARPYDLGAVVINVSTAKAISDAFQHGMPLIERAITISGDKVENPGNYLVRIGTSVEDLLHYCGAIIDEDVTVKMGGPMMGVELDSYDVPVIKGTNGVIAMDTDPTHQSGCIRCGRCVDVCPMELLPLYYPIYDKESNLDAMREKAITDCIECGCCDFICSSRIPIRQSVKNGKKAIREEGK